MNEQGRFPEGFNYFFEKGYLDFENIYSVELILRLKKGLYNNLDLVEKIDSNFKLKDISWKYFIKILLDVSSKFNYQAINEHIENKSNIKELIEGIRVIIKLLIKELSKLENIFKNDSTNKLILDFYSIILSALLSALEIKSNIPNNTEYTTEFLKSNCIQKPVEHSEIINNKLNQFNSLLKEILIDLKYTDISSNNVNNIKDTEFKVKNNFDCKYFLLAIDKKLDNFTFQSDTYCQEIKQRSKRNVPKKTVIRAFWRFLVINSTEFSFRYGINNLHSTLSNSDIVLLLNIALNLSRGNKIDNEDVRKSIKKESYRKNTANYISIINSST